MLKSLGAAGEVGDMELVAGSVWSTEDRGWRELSIGYAPSVLDSVGRVMGLEGVIPSPFSTSLSY